MAGLFGTKSQSTTSTTKQSSTPNFGNYTGYLNTAAGKISDMLNGKTSTYDGELTSGWTGDQQYAMDTAKSTLGNSYLNDVLGGKYLDYSTDKSYLSAADKLRKNLGSAIDSTKTAFNKGGYLSSSGYEKGQASNVNDYGSSLAELEGKFSDAAKSQILQALGVQNSALGTYSTLANAKQQVQTEADQAKYKEWLRQQGVAENAIPYMMQFMNLVKGTDTVQDSNSATSTQKSFLGL